MTIDGHHMVMNGVRIAELKTHLSRHLRRVRAGRTLTVLDRDTPVALIVPYDAETPLEVRKAIRAARELRLPAPPASPTDSLAILLKDRSTR
jgi:antitoxin (DNA-binding transcriptional repressor) of toxin-antitoxin stability system